MPTSHDTSIDLNESKFLYTDASAEICQGKTSLMLNPTIATEPLHHGDDHLQASTGANLLFIHYRMYQTHSQKEIMPHKLIHTCDVSTLLTFTVMIKRN